MSKDALFTLFLLIGVLFGLKPGEASAQNNLDRISTVERSDGKGYVVRYHLEEMVDSFKVVHSSPDLIQMSLYSTDLDTAGIQFPPVSSTFQNVHVHYTPQGLGVDIFLGAQNYFKAIAYSDQNGKDVLLALEKTSLSEVEKITENTDPIIWGMESPAITFEDQDNSFLQLRDDMDFDVIVLDAGHGGKDPGSSNRKMGLQEKDIALSVTLKVGEYIEQNLPDVDVVYTRTEDEFIPLEERGLMANRAGGDLFVSIHANSVRTPNASGSEIFFLGLERSESALDVMKRENSVLELENGNGTLELSEEELLIYELANSGNIAVSERIAAMVENQFRARAQRRSRGVKQARLVVLWHASMPAILVELGFLSNPQEARYMNSDYGQSILASAIFRAIRDFKLEYDKSMRQPVQNSASNE
ncbi:MAG: N-acetylmuramoyl-L-alanine amidase [Balneolaceae bacterium]